MLKLGRVLMWAVLAAAAVGLLVYTRHWLDWRRDGTPMPSGTEAGWLVCAALMGAAWWLLHGLRGLQRTQDAEQLQAVRKGQVFEASSGIGWGLISPPLIVLFGYATWALAKKGDWAPASATLVMLLVALLTSWHLLRQVLRPGPMLRMDAQVIDHALYGPIPWRDVVGMHLQIVTTRYKTHHTLLLGVRHASRYMRNAPPLLRWRHARRPRHPEDVGVLSLTLDVLGRDPALIHEAARSFRDRVDAPFLSFWDPRMSAADAAALLELQVWTEGSGRLADELQALSASEDPAAFAEADARMQAHFQRHEALWPNARRALETGAARARGDSRAGWILLVVIVVMSVLGLALRILR